MKITFKTYELKRPYIILSTCMVLLASILFSAKALLLTEIDNSSMIGGYYKPWDFTNEIVDAKKDKDLNITIQKGDSFHALLSRHRVDNNDVDAIKDSLKASGFNPAKLNIGQVINLRFDEEGILYSLALKADKERSLEISRNQYGSFEAKENIIPMQKKFMRANGKINGSFIVSAKKAGVPPAILNDIIKAFSYTIDFQRDVHLNDSFDIVYESYHYNDNKRAKTGKVMYASLNIAGRDVAIYRYKTKEGDIEFYDSNGNNVRREFLRTPLNVTRISSGFGMRKHPILGYSKMHKGVDFAAPIGTPIFAAGSGVIEQIGRHGGYGNYIKIKHKNGIATAYGHISRFEKGLKKDSQVKQGQVIAFVGTTGRSTAPHLHFEILVNNKHINPLSMKSTPGEKLAKSELKSFNAYVSNIDSYLDKNTSSKELAMDIFAKYNR